MSVNREIAVRHFGRKVVAALASRGVTFNGLQGIPGPSGGFLDGTTGYVVNDNGTGRVWTYAETVRAAA
jgi:hypothetical protein